MKNVALLHIGQCPNKLIKALDHANIKPVVFEFADTRKLDSQICLFLVYISFTSIEDYFEHFLTLKKMFPHASFFIIDRIFRFNNKMMFMSAGANLYLYYPLNVKDLIRYINFYVARYKAATNNIVYKDIVLNVNKRTVSRGEVTYTLRNKEFELLKYFLLNTGEIISKTKIIEEIWDMNASIDTRTVETHISYLRNKIDKGFEEKRLQTIYCVGYKFE